uniref:DUF4939 domain-containing protein n=1 Tax=Sinocyclocheilus grahami TaxID=75366 RepID=A0A672MEQ4_SINGR
MLPRVCVCLCLVVTTLNILLLNPCRPRHPACLHTPGPGFLLQCSRYLEMQPHLFVTERAKVSFIISLLTGPTLQWAESPGIHSLEGFVRHFREREFNKYSLIIQHDKLRP